MTLIDYALKYLSMGFSVIPLRARDKQPTIQWTPFRTRLPTQDEVNSWFSDGQKNIAIICGEVSGGLIVLDFDDQAIMPYIISDIREVAKKTMVVRTAKGYHIYYKIKEQPNFRLPNLKVDVKGEGGYVVAPPSIHPTGMQYQIVGTTKVAEMKNDLLDFLRECDQTYPIAKEIAPIWGSDSAHRHELALGLSSFFRARAKWSQEESERFIEALMRLKGDKEEVDDRLRAVADAYKKEYPYDRHLPKELVESLAKLLPAGTGLDQNKWFSKATDGKFKFSPHNCANDYLSVYPNVRTEYLGTIHQFIGNRWLKDAEPYIRSEIERVGVLTPEQIGSAVEAIRNLTRITEPNEIDLPLEKIMPLPDHVIPITDGLMNLRTREILPHSPKYYYTECIPRKYLKGAIPKTLLYILDRMFQGDPRADQKRVQFMETIAWTLMRNYNIHGAVILYGQGGEGKSILQAVIEDVVVFTSSITLGELEKDKFKRPELYGSWANTVAESSDDVVTSEWFKRTTDGTTITADRKNGHPFKFVNHAKFIISVNELPEREHELRSFYRRVALIIDFLTPLEQTLAPTEIDGVVKKLKEEGELDAVFSYTIEHFYQPLTERMKFTSHLTATEAEEKWEERSDPALPYIRTKLASDEILTDVETAEERIKSLGIARPENYFAKDKNSLAPYLVTIKDPVVRAAIKWSTERGFPGKKVTSGTIGRALTKNNLPNISVHKKVGNSSPVAWKDIAILPDDLSNGSNGSGGDAQLPPKNPQQPHGDGMSNGRPPIPVDWVNEKNRKEDRDGSITPAENSSNSGWKNEVTGDFPGTVTEAESERKIKQNGQSDDWQYFRVREGFSFGKYTYKKGKVSKFPMLKAGIYIEKGLLELPCPNGQIWDPFEKQCVLNKGN